MKEIKMEKANEFGPLMGAIDEGTSSARFIIFKAGTDKIVCYHQISVPQIFPQEGWVEQDPILIWNTVKECITEAVKKLINLGGNPKDILSIGITNQRETTIVWDKITGQPLYNAIIWLDMRTSSTVEQLLDNVPNNSKNKNYLKPLCGLPLSPYFSAVKLKWLKDNVLVVKQAMEKGTCLFGTVDSWLIWNLTGGINGGIHITDVTNASRTMLMNIETLQWDSYALKFFQIPAQILPKIKSSSEIYGSVYIEPLKDIPIAGCLGDQQAALIGQECLSMGQAKATYGTGCFLLYNTGVIPVNSPYGLLTTVAYQLGKNAPPIYALEGSVAIAGAAFGWLKDNMCLLNDFDEIEKLASSVENCGDVYFVPAFSGLYAPYWNQEARGVICGITDEVKTEHIIRATLEAVCYQVRDILDAMSKDCGKPLLKLKVDGGMTSNKLLLQMQSDLVGIEVIKSRIAETTSLGAAMVAYRAVSNWNMQLPKLLKENINFIPQITENERDMRYTKWKMAIERSFGWESTSTEDKKLISP